jgi:hypothetical protein
MLLQLLKREGKMNIIPLFKEESRKEVEKVNIEIPADWWNSSYSSTFTDKSETIFPISKIHRHQANRPIVTPGWNLRSGDYRVKDRNVDTKDYIYYRELKLKIAKYSLYPVIVATVLLIIKVSAILSKI